MVIYSYNTNQQDSLILAFSLLLYMFVCVCVYRQLSSKTGNDMERAETFRIIKL